MKMEASVDPQCRGPDWMPITPKTGSLFHAETHIAPLVEAVQTLSADLSSLATRVSSLETAVAGFANRFTTKQLCVEKSDGTPVCLTGDQLSNILSGTPSVQLSAPAPIVISGTTAPPSVNIQGNNPATINVGDTYTDLGAIVHDNQGRDLSYRTFINGVLSGNRAGPGNLDRTISGISA
jgi:hypothetical protein